MRTLDRAMLAVLLPDEPGKRDFEGTTADAEDDERVEPVLSTSLSVQPVLVGHRVGHGVVGCLCCRFETVKLTDFRRS